MDIAHQYEVTITCHMPWRPMMGPHDPQFAVFTVRGDYETVSKSLGLPGSDTRNQLDRFESSLKAQTPPPSLG